jgi:exonuclease SbcC
MPRLPENSSTLSDLRLALERVLPNSRLEELEIDSWEEPLLFLMMPRTVAAFALSGSDPHESYNKLYSGFKKYCTESRHEWDGLDLVFVFCVRPSQPNLEQLASSVETDVYFCRKFVVRIIPDIAMVLARLPFLPLVALAQISMRPPSAQTLLQQCGMHSDLARNLVVQRERGSEGIVEDCVKTLFGPPSALAVPTNLPPSPYETNASSVRMDTITIENFRAYRSPRTFKLGRDVTILYGPNGFGKTSFFDAVDFALTGGIGRLSSLTDQSFIKATKHLDAGADEGRVSASFVSSAGEIKLTRRVSSRKQAQMDGRDAERKSVLTQLTGGRMASADRVENFVTLFRATHLFSQEQQELVTGFSANCELPSNIVSRMLAFEDYSNAVTKATAVRNILADRVQTAEQKHRELTAQLAAERLELERLSRIADNVPSTETLAAEISSLRSKIEASQVSIVSEADSAIANVATVRSWRAAIEIAQGESRSRSERLIALTTDLARRPQLNAELDSIRNQIALKEGALTTANDKQSNLEQELLRQEANLNQLVSRRAEEEKRHASIQWVRTIRPEFARLLQRHEALTTELQALVQLIEGDRAAEAAATSRKREADGVVLEHENGLVSGNQHLANLRKLVESLEGWVSAQRRLTDLQVTERQRSLELTQLQEAAPTLARTFQDLKSQEERLRRELASAESSQTELTNLLAQLQTHVSSGFCLACGVDHGTKDELLSRMRRVANTNSAATRIHSELTESQVKLEQAVTASNENKQRQDAINAELRGTFTERQRANETIEAFESLVAMLGFSSFEAVPALRVAIAARQAQAQRDVESATDRLSRAKQSLEQVETAIRTSKTSLQTRIDDASGKRIALAQIEAELAALRDDPRQILAPLDTTEEQLNSLLFTAEQDLAERRDEASRAEATVSNQRPNINSARQEVVGLKSQVAALRGQLSGLQRTVSEFESRFRESNIPMDTDERGLQERVSAEAARQTHLTELSETASNLEIAMDAATTAAALRQMQQNFRTKEAEAAHEAIDKAQCEPWHRYFESIIKILLAEQNKAIANFTKAYGPRTSIIQARLRSVYGFEDVEMQTRDGAIVVRVRRNGEELRPIDYFSQSQVQTLLLGLFLAASTSQTWSGFCPILLDDPVTHFDDLNVYSFLDLIAGLLETERGRRQFIISTCDQKLMKLARQKFRNGDGSVAFYRFSDIGTNGPTVEEMAFS